MTSTLKFTSLRTMWQFKVDCRLNEMEISTNDYTLTSDNCQEEQILMAINQYGAVDITDRHRIFDSLQRQS